MPRLLYTKAARGKEMAKNDLQGTLDLLVLKTLAHNGALHGYGIVLHIQSASNDLLRVEEGSLYPALQRLLLKEYLVGEWGKTSDSRRARYYKLTSAGRKQLGREVQVVPPHGPFVRPVIHMPDMRNVPLLQRIVKLLAAVQQLVAVAAREPEEAKLFAGLVVQKFSPVPFPKRMVRGKQA